MREVADRDHDVAGGCRTSVSRPGDARVQRQSMSAGGLDRSGVERGAGWVFRWGLVGHAERVHHHQPNVIGQGRVHGDPPQLLRTWINGH